MRFNTTVPGLTLFPGMGGQPPWAADITTSQIVEVARAAERARIDQLVIPWHLAMARGDAERTMGPRWPGALAAAGFLLGATERITVVPLVVVPHTHPVELAKSLATLDWMSGGRCTPVLMAGYQRWEFDLLGAPYEDRDAVTDEYAEAMQVLWSSDEPTYEGRWVRFDGVVFEPKPHRRPYPLWFGGRSKRALARVGRFGGGWMSYATPHREIPAAIEHIRQHRPAGDDGPVEVSAYFVEATHDPVSHEEAAPPVVPVGRDAVMDQLARLASLGVGWTQAPLASMPGGGDSFASYLERLDWFGREIRPEAAQL